MFPCGFINSSEEAESFGTFKNVVEEVGKTADGEDNDNTDPGKQNLIHDLIIAQALFSFGVEFGEFFGFFIQLSKIFFRDFFGFTGINEVPEHTNQDKWANESGMKNGPHNNTDYSRAGDIESNDVLENFRDSFAGFGKDLDGFRLQCTHRIWECLKNEISNTKENAADNDEGN